MIWVTLARVIPSCRAISAWLATLPDSRRACHSMAFRRSSTTRGVFGTTAWFAQAGPRLPPGWEAPVASGRRCYRFQTPPWARGRFRRSVRGRCATGRHLWPSWARWTIRNQTSGSDLAVSIPAHLGSQHFSKPVDGVFPRPRAFFFPFPVTLRFPNLPLRPCVRPTVDRGKFLVQLERSKGSSSMFLFRIFC